MKSATAGGGRHAVLPKFPHSGRAALVICFRFTQGSGGRHKVRPEPWCAVACDGRTLLVQCACTVCLCGLVGLHHTHADASVIGARRLCRHPDTGLACQMDLACVLAVARPVVVCRRFSAADVPAQNAAVGMVSHNWCWLPLLLPVPSHAPINVMSPPLLVPSPRGAQRASPRAMRHGLAAQGHV